MTQKHGVIAVVTVLCLGFAGTASATVITPTTTTDDLSNNGNCTLREAVQAANTDTAVDQCPAGSGTDVIKLTAGSYVLSLTGIREDANQTGDLDVTAPVTIEGPTSGQPATIDAKSIDRAIDLQPDAPTTIEHLTITDGAAPRGLLFGTSGESGGAIRASSALTLVNVIVTQSTAGSGTKRIVVPGFDGASGGDGGGVSTDAALTIIGGRFVTDQAGSGAFGTDGRSATGTAGTGGQAGGAGGPGGSGGAVAVTGGAPLTITGTSFSHDGAGDGGSGGNGGTGAGSGTGSGGSGGSGGNGGPGGSGGAVFVDRAARISHVTISSTNAGSGGVGGLGGGGGGGHTAVGTNGNAGNGGDGGRGGAIAATDSQLTISSAIIAQTTAGSGGAAVDQTGFGGNLPGGGDLAGAGGAGGAISGLGPVSVNQTLVELAHAGAAGLGSPAGYPVQTPGSAGGTGGGVDGQDVAVTDSTVTASSGGAGGTGGIGGFGAPAGAGGPGGGGGAVHATVSLMLHGDTFSHDSSGTGGNGGSENTLATPGGRGGVGGEGGAVLADGSAAIDDSTFVDDRAGTGGAGGDNTATNFPKNGGPGGAGGDDGAVHVVSASSTLVHATIVGGAAGAGGAGGSSAGATAGAPGPAGTTGAVAGPATLIASVIDASGIGQCSGTSDGGSNLSFPDPSCGGIHVAPKLAALASNGGPTETFLPQAGSPVLDKIPKGSLGCSGSATDQRGVPRPQGPACDLGAVEAANPALAVHPRTLAFGSLASGRTAKATLTIKNTFDPVRVSSALSGAQPSAFAITANGCRGRLLSPHASCRISLRFTAGGTRGPRSATLHVTHNTAGPPLTVRLTGQVIRRGKRR